MVEQRNFGYTREFNWDVAVPTSEAKDWNCKYRVMSDEKLLGGVGEEEKTVLDFTLTRFDDYVYVIIQEKGQMKNVEQN